MRGWASTAARPIRTRAGDAESERAQKDQIFKTRDQFVREGDKEPIDGARRPIESGKA
ncbi:MAG: hypothetical protein KDD85_11670 [Parvularculaceae bacterium]|nr:hypothetical protein [Parvularculaceae bacterium]